MPYPKTYATIVARRYDREITARTEDGIEHDLLLEWRNGKSSTSAFVRGVRIKLYRRPGRPHLNFRKVGD